MEKKQKQMVVKDRINWCGTLTKWICVLIEMFLMGWNFAWIYRAIKTDMPNGCLVFSLACVINLIMWQLIKSIGISVEVFDDEDEDEDKLNV